MKTFLITGFVVAYSACAVSAGDRLSDGQLDAVTAGSASASASADAIGIIAATTTFTFAETRANSGGPAVDTSPARNQASALLQGNYSPAPSDGASGGGATGEASMSQSSSSANTNTTPTTPVTPASDLTAAQRVLLGVR